MLRKGLFVVGCGVGLLAALTALVVLLRGTGELVVVEAPAGDTRYRRETIPLEFSVVTYNIQGRPVLDDTRGKFPEIGRRLGEFDLVAFQECFVNHEYLWGALDHPVKVFDNTLRNSWKLVGSGLSTVGRFPLVGLEHMHFGTRGELQNRPASKGILLTRFDIDGHTVDLYNTHMEAGRGRLADEARFQQVDELIAFVQAKSPPEHTVILAGDFNMRPLREFHGEFETDSKLVGFQRMLEGLGPAFRDVSDEIHGTPGPLSADNHDALWRRRPGGPEDVDRVLLRAGAGVRVYPLSWDKPIEDFRADTGELLSDHDPIVVVFRLAAGEQE